MRPSRRWSTIIGAIALSISISVPMTAATAAGAPKPDPFAGQVTHSPTPAPSRATAPVDAGPRGKSSEQRQVVPNPKGDFSVTWTPGSYTITGQRGSVVPLELPLTFTGTPQELAYEVTSPLKDLVVLDLERSEPSPDGTVVVPGQLQIPLSSKTGNITGQVWITNAGRRSEPPLHFKINVLEAAATVVPSVPSAPTPDRIGQLTPTQQAVNDELVVVLADSVVDPSARIQELAKKYEAVIQGAVPDLRMYQLRFSAPSFDNLTRQKAALQSEAGVESVSFNLVTGESVMSPSKTPNDPKWDSWDTEHPGGNNYDLEMINAPAAWDKTTGSKDIKVAVIDSDLDKAHSDLKNNVTYSGGRGTSGSGHGTHVSGTVCAQGNNGIGTTGMMWDCALLQIPYGRDTVTAAAAMKDAVNQGARIVNMSLQFVENLQGRPSPVTASTLDLVKDSNDVLSRPILAAARNKQDVLWVFAAGNERRDAKYSSPASLVQQFPENTMAVASVGASGALSSFSDFGDLVTVAAPGEDVLSTLPRTCKLWIFCSDNYGSKSGTSMAAPHVTGLAGLVASKDPSRSAVKIKSCITGAAAGKGKQVAGQKFSVIDAPSAVDCTGTLDLPAKVDVVLQLDLTGSMGGVLSQAQAQAQQAVNDLKAASPTTDFRFSVTSLEDYPGSFGPSCGSTYSATYGDSSDVPFRQELASTSDAAKVQDVIKGLSLGSGADGPESYGRALWELGQSDTQTSLGLRSDALKLVIVFGDSLPHDKNVNQDVEGVTGIVDTGIDPGRNGKIDCGGDDIDFQDNALTALTSSKTRLLFVDSSYGSGIEAYWRKWSSVTGGAYTQLTPSDGRTLGQVIIDLLKLMPKAS